LFTRLRRKALPTVTLDRLGHTWLHFLKLKGFLFFGSVKSVKGFVEARIDSGRARPHHERLRFVIYDCTNLDGMDASAAKAMCSLSKDCLANEIDVIWIASSPSLQENLRRWGLVAPRQKIFSTANSAVHFAEEAMLKEAETVQQCWLNLHTEFSSYHKHRREVFGFDPFGDGIFPTSGQNRIPYDFCDRKQFDSYEVLEQDKLYLIHNGTVAMFNSGESLRDPLAVYGPGMFVMRGMALRYPEKRTYVTLSPCVVVTWTASQLLEVRRKAPQVRLCIDAACGRQCSRDAEIWKSESMLRGFGAVHRNESHKNVDQPEVKLAHFFRTHAMYEGGGVCPQLPQILEADARLAFFAYTEQDVDHKERRSNLAKESLLKQRLPQGKVSAALAYTGLSHDLLEAVNNTTDCTEAADDTDKTDTDKTIDFTAFADLCREHAMVPVSEKLKERLKMLFDEFDADKSGGLDLEQLQHAIFILVGTKISEEMCSVFMEEWDEDESGCIDFEEFMHMMSRLAKTVKWEGRVMKGFYDLTKNCETLSEKDLVDCGVPEDMAAKMIWMVCVKRQCPGEPLITVDEVITELGLLCFHHLPPPLLPKRLLLPALPTKVAVTHSDESEKEAIKVEVAPWKKSLHDYTNTSVYHGCVLCVITLSVFAMILESLNELESKLSHPGWLVSEVIFTILFIGEFAIRCMTIEVDGISWGEFWKSPLNILDIIAISPLFLYLALQGLVASTTLDSLRTVRMFRLFRMITLAKLKAYEGVLRIFGPSMAIVIVTWAIYLKEH